METVTISKVEYESLVEESQWLACLEAAGVDNWCGYEYAQDIHREMHGEEDDDE